MIRTLLKEVKEYKAASIATPFFMILEVLFETLIPFLMASIIDKGVNTGDIHHIYKVGGIMIVAAFCGLLAGMAGGRYGAKASTGFAKNLRNKRNTLEILWYAGNSFRKGFLLRKQDGIYSYGIYRRDKFQAVCKKLRWSFTELYIV